MYTRDQDSQTARNRVEAAIITLLFLFNSAVLAQVPPPPSSYEQNTEKEVISHDVTHMPEKLRSGTENLVVIAGTSPAEKQVGGTYEKDTLGVFGGMDRAEDLTTISKDVGPVPVSFGLPVLYWPAAIIGGIAGASQRELQEFRDAMADELSNAAGQPLTNDKLAADVFWGIRNIPSVDSKLFAPTTPIPEGTDSILYVSLEGVAIDVQGKEAIITLVAGATFHRADNGSVLYETKVHYQDRDTLGNWIENDNALWRDYANFARHYLGREISAELFERVKLNHELRPKKSDTVATVKKNDWQGISKSVTPTLAWQLDLLGGDAYGEWAKDIDESNVTFELELYDMHRPVYSETGIADRFHTLPVELEACQTYRWSVRPIYHVGNKVRYGEWMRNEPEIDPDAGDTPRPVTPVGIIGRQASVAPAMLQDFASLEIKCGRR